MGPEDKLYVAVRSDLIPGLQTAQACHAAIQYILDFPEEAREWNTLSNYIGILSVTDEDELIELKDNARNLGLKVSTFREPDLDNTYTAIAIEPGCVSKTLCYHLPLALSEFAMV